MKETIRVICDRCRAEGAAGDPAFTAIPDILDFDPVPVRSHANNWTPEHQRAFIAALAMTGSVNQAARAIGRYSAGADRLRKARGGRAFSEAWDSALEIARDRDLAEMRDNLRGSSKAHAAHAAASATAGRADPGRGKWVEKIYGDAYDPDEFLEGHEEMVETQGRIRERMLMARRFMLADCADDSHRRAAWECLVGKVDWERARNFEPQDDEGPEEYCGAPALLNMRGADMQICAENKLLAPFIGGEDALEHIPAMLAEAIAEAEGNAEHSERPRSGE